MNKEEDYSLHYRHVPEIAYLFVVHYILLAGRNTNNTAFETYLLARLRSRYVLAPHPRTISLPGNGMGSIPVVAVVIVFLSVIPSSKKILSALDARSEIVLIAAEAAQYARVV